MSEPEIQHIEPEIHHIGHPSRHNETYCGIPMPPEQSQVRTRGPVRICPECARRFKSERPKRKRTSQD